MVYEYSTFQFYSMWIHYTVNQAKHVDKKYSLLGFPDRVISGSVLSLGEPSLVWSSTPIRLEGRERGLRGSLTLNNSQLSKNTTLQLEEKLFLAKPKCLQKLRLLKMISTTIEKLTYW